ncbi:hypothetical protein DNU06_13160 [Putridiphycobacter roseus]|uniref:DUF547 domain-containing protein n=1 Tax=Putridiphycobacter roseus TaxID=2219161 RepID=A0A2W1MWJ7_9FLAO|nr:DUF547 domain-containing protein [Putridiphycobacter roseus]PZE16489.1 hypothetical protein DNU06_13160 [Putridiphycobacter roseus]
MYRFNLILIIAIFLISCNESNSSENVVEQVNEEKLRVNEQIEFEEITVEEDLVQTEALADEVKVLSDEMEEEIEPTKNEKTALDQVKKTSKDIAPLGAEEETIEEVVAPKPEIVKLKPNHDKWNALLQQHVSAAGKVNYTGMKSDFEVLTAYVKYLESFASQNGWTKNERLAYWINLYNAATVRLICENYPLSSITDLSGGKPWDQKVVQVGLKSYTLNDIENKVIRPVFKDARIHFAVNCAAISCPKLMNSAFTAVSLNRQLEKQTASFINSAVNKLEVDNIEVSKIFDWYGSDFENGNIVDFINVYANISIQKNAKISFNEYNWDLNEQ